jgi:hypothetical protein
VAKHFWGGSIDNLAPVAADPHGNDILDLLNTTTIVAESSILSTKTNISDIVDRAIRSSK